MRSNLVEVGASDINPSHDQVGTDVTLVPGQRNLLNHFLYKCLKILNNRIFYIGFNATVLQLVENVQRGTSKSDRLP